MAGPAGWEKLYGPYSDGSILEHYVFAKSATGSESGTAAFTHTGSSDAAGRMYRFTDWKADGTMANNFEGANTSGGSSSNTIADAGVTTTGADRLAVQFVSVGDNNALDAFTGQTGGTWAEAVAEYTNTTGTDFAMGLQIATMASAGTIDGGTDTMAAADPWHVIGFAIIGTTGSPAETPFPYIGGGYHE